jgi:hypothetical protein
MFATLLVLCVAQIILEKWMRWNTHKKNSESNKKLPCNFTCCSMFCRSIFSSIFLVESPAVLYFYLSHKIEVSLSFSFLVYRSFICAIEQSRKKKTISTKICAIVHHVLLWSCRPCQTQFGRGEQLGSASDGKQQSVAEPCRWDRQVESKISWNRRPRIRRVRRESRSG